MKLLLYCTKGKPYLNDYRLNEYCNKFVTMSKPVDDVNGKIVAECDYEVEEIYYLSFMNKKLRERIYKESCLSDEELSNYMNGHDTMYAIHIENLNIFDKPKELSDYYTFDSEKHININYCKPITNLPKNMMYCWTLQLSHNVIFNGFFQKNILVPVHPKLLCKILNGEKTIEVRKKVLKEMVENENKK